MISKAGKPWPTGANHGLGGQMPPPLPLKETLLTCSVNTVSAIVNIHDRINEVLQSTYSSLFLPRQVIHVVL